MTGHTKEPELLEAAHKAAATIQAFYQWIDMIEEAGGCGSIAGIAKANAFIKSMKSNRARLDKLVMEPLNAATARAARGDAALTQPPHADKGVGHG